MANFALNYSFTRNLNIPLDEDAVKSTLQEVKDYVQTKGKCYAGQLFSVTGDTTTNNGLYITLTTGLEGSVIKLASQDALDAVEAAAGKIDVIQLNGSALTINDKVVNIDLSDYASLIYVNSAVSQSLADAKAYTDTKVAEVEENFNWLPVEGDTEVHKVRHWKGTRAKYEILVKNNATNPYTRYVVIDEISGENVITEYFGTNQVYDITGQLLPVNSIISNINEIVAEPYSRYLVGENGVGYSVYECVLDEDNVLKWKIRTFDYRYGIRVMDKGLKNYVYVNGTLITYDDVDGGEF